MTGVEPEIQMTNEPEGIREAPTKTLQILKNIGPGMILAGSIIGSGELIATTRTGAEAHFDFLWLSPLPDSLLSGSTSPIRKLFL
jgi:hypothetical protein